jgi:pyrroline-5-carboxylate reductase
LKQQEAVVVNPKIAFIGGGNMASAIVGGLVSQGFDAGTITVSDPMPETLARLAAVAPVKTTTDNLAAVKDADVIVLAVKPQVMAQVCKPLAETLARTKPLIISIAAGITLQSLQQWLGEGLAIVRSMPNTPALVQTGATALFGNIHTNTRERDIADRLLRAVGITAWTDSEEQLDAVTALSGSGPAYFFLVIEAMTAAGIALGLAPELATQLTLQTALGAAKMAAESDVDAAELRKRVTSPGGTTLAALTVMEQRELRDIFSAALGAAEQRSRELAAQFGKQ